MRIGVAFSPTADWPGIVAGARAADEGGLESVGFWDHYHSERPEWSYIAGWSAHAALAAVTQRVRIVPMVLCNLNHRLGQLAKESSVLATVSGGRFELAIGAGDYPVEYRAFHEPFPDAPTRLALLEETVAALRELWRGGAVTFHGEHVELTDAASTPAPERPPRIVVGVGGSRRMVDSAVAYADELNLYGERTIVAYARERVAAAGRPIALSLYRHYTYEAWPGDVQAIADDLAPWQAEGIERVFVNVGYDWDKPACVAQLVEAQTLLGGAARGPA